MPLSHKVQFHSQPDVHSHFLDNHAKGSQDWTVRFHFHFHFHSKLFLIFPLSSIDTPGVIKHVSHLFNGRPFPYSGLFVPVGYSIECSSDTQHSSFITPTGTMLQSTRDDPWHTAPAAVPFLDSSSIETAVQYVQKIQQRFDDAMYRRFLEILRKYHNTTDAVNESEMSVEITRLFKDDPDLHSDFRIFMPEKSQGLFDDAEESYLLAPTGRRTRSNTPLDDKPVLRCTDPQPPLEPTVPQKLKWKVNEQDTTFVAPKASSRVTA
ncbi:hypothetical protein DEU56DRAFT_739075 [Suillus clintonianus]|uniref:uncharacterized protein n=1 Tax=Suillus clintonianus TaxID=1904413 RepID=UPI001B87E42D|nr:uncharacterized protein DEU56DRAFT_739075 [Suillus clintonianus]KAG2133331.1 hypothetical protein DEU56DRAFT_739075 [Suillus clintonianus]